MGLLDRVTRGGRGMPGRALVIVNRSPGPERGKVSLRTLLRVRLRPLPEGSGPDNDVTQLVPSHQAHLITAGMEIPALLDPETQQPVGVQKEGLDEAIGRHFLGLEPQHGTWEAAFKAKRKELRQDTGVLSDVRHGIDQVRNVKDAAKSLPGGVSDTASEWKAGLAEIGGDDHPAGEPVEGVGFEAWVEVKAGLSRDSVPEDGQRAYAEEHGVPAGRWDVVNSTWEQRVQWNQLASTLYAKAMADASKGG
jgi:hypothetical protein